MLLLRLHTLNSFLQQLHRVNRSIDDFQIASLLRSALRRRSARTSRRPAPQPRAPAALSRCCHASCCLAVPARILRVSATVPAACSFAGSHHLLLPLHDTSEASNYVLRSPVGHRPVFHVSKHVSERDQQPALTLADGLGTVLHGLDADGRRLRCAGLLRRHLRPLPLRVTTIREPFNFVMPSDLRQNAVICGPPTSTEMRQCDPEGLRSSKVICKCRVIVHLSRRVTVTVFLPVVGAGA